MHDFVKEIYSPGKEYKVEINKRLRDGLLEIDVLSWDSEWETWLQESSGFSLTFFWKDVTDNVEVIFRYSGFVLMVVCGFPLIIDVFRNFLK